MFQAAWVDGRNVADESEMRSIVAGAGLDAVALADAVQQPAIKKALIDETNQAVERGVFGAPTMFVAGAMHFGQDRLPWIERALSEK